MIRDDSEENMLMVTQEEKKQEEQLKIDKLVNTIKELINPNNKIELIELDSIYQLKSLFKNYYLKKGKLGEKLTAKLDAILTDRPKNLQLMKKHFFGSYEQEEEG